MIDEELKKALLENKETLKDIDKRMHRIEKKFIWNTIFGFLKFLVIWAPIIAGVIYFTPVLKDYVKIFDPVINSFKINALNVANLNSNENSSNFALETFCDSEARDVLVEQLCK